MTARLLTAGTLLAALFMLAACAGGKPLTTDPQSLLATPTTSALGAVGAVETTPGAPENPAGNVESNPPGQPAYPPPVEASPDDQLPVAAPTAEPQLPSLTGDGWQPLAPGVDYRIYRDAPNTQDPIHVARMSRSRADYPDLTLDTLKGYGYLYAWGLEGVAQQARRAEDALNFWGDAGREGAPFWGKRNRVLVAINGSLLDTTTTADENKITVTEAGLPNQGMVQSGWYMDRFQDFQNRSGFVWTLDGRAFIGGCVTHPGDEQAVVLNTANPNSELKISGVNVPRSADRGVFLYTPQYGLTTRQEPKKNSLSVEVVVELESPLLITPLGQDDLLNGGPVRGQIKAVRRNELPARIEFNQVVISAYGFNAEKLISHTEGREGATVVFYQQVVDSPANDCKAASGKDWTETYAAIGVDVPLVDNGEPVIPTSDGIAPRTAVAINRDYIFLIAAEGHPYRTAEGEPGRTGMTLWDLANFIAAELEGQYAANLDGGGSTTMVINGRVVTRPGDYFPMICSQVYAPGVLQAKPHQNAAYPAPGEPAAGIAPPSQQGADDLAAENGITAVWGQASPDGVCQRPVVNGLAIVAAEPMIKSRALSTGQPALTKTLTPLRQGPGNNYGIFERLPAGTPLTIANPGNSLNGIYATGTFWWYVQLDELSGWVDERNLD